MACGKIGLVRKVDDRGAVIPIIAVILVAMLVILAFVIDIPSEELIAKQVQAASDAAALAGASELDGTAAGFIRAKQAAVAALKGNKIKGASQNFGDNRSFALNSGPIYNQTTDGAIYRGTSGASGNLSVTIERGLYWSSVDGSNYEFTSLEDASTGTKFGLPLTTFANAVQVSVRINNIDTMFAKVFGIGAYQPIGRSSKAVNDSELEREVAPFAVRACDLLLDTSPSVTHGTHFTENYSPAKQCERNSITFREPLWDTAGAGPLTITPPYDLGTTGKTRRGGYYRYLEFKRPPLYSKGGTGSDVCFPSGTGPGTYVNCKALPMMGALGIPGTSYSKASAAEILGALSGSPILAKVGQPFRSLEDPTPLWSTSTRTGGGLDSDQALASWINSGSLALASEFYSGSTPTAEFPWLRTSSSGSDKNLYLRDYWPDDNNNKQSFIMQAFTANQWTNPMCHADGVAVNNKTTAKGRKAWVPVLAATKRQGDSDIILCDWDRTFSDQTSRSTPVVSLAEPRIIGFLKIDAYDGNFLDLDTKFPATGVNSTATPYAVDPTTGTRVTDGNPAQLEMNGDKIPELKELKKKIHKFHEDHDKYWDCVGRTRTSCSSSKPDTSGISSILSSSTWYSKCFNFASIYGDPRNPRNPGGLLLNKLGQYSPLATNNLLQSYGTCIGFRCVRPTYFDWSKGASQAFGDFFSQLDALIDAPIAANPGAHCTPVPLPNSPDLDDSGAWEPMGPVKAGVGCGGIQATLDECSGDISFSTGKTKASNKPALVN